MIIVVNRTGYSVPRRIWNATQWWENNLYLCHIKKTRGEYHGGSAKPLLLSPGLPHNFHLRHSLASLPPPPPPPPAPVSRVRLASPFPAPSRRASNLARRSFVPRAACVTSANCPPRAPRLAPLRIAAPRPLARVPQGASIGDGGVRPRGCSCTTHSPPNPQTHSPPNHVSCLPEMR